MAYVTSSEIVTGRGNEGWNSYLIKTIDGKTRFVPLNARYLRGVVETPRTSFHLQWKWPFIRKEVKSYTKFRQYYNDGYAVKTYRVACTAAAFLDLIGVPHNNWIEDMMKTDVKYGYHD